MPRKRKANKHLPERVYLKHGAYYFVDQSNKWLRLGKTLSEAMQRWSDLLEKPTDLTYMNQLFDRYMIEVSPKKAESTYKGNVEQMKLLRGVFGHMRPHEIKPTNIYEYIDERGKKAPTAANREKELLSHVFTMAIRWGAAASNPCKLVKRLSIKKRTRYIRDDEFMAVRAQASMTLKLLMDFAYLTGLRRGDILAVELKDLTDDGIYIQINKTGGKLLIEWSADLIKTVEAIHDFYGASLRQRNTLFCTRQGSPYSGRGISAMWQRLMNAVIEQQIIDERFTFHDIRRKAATDGERDHGREYARQLLGHTSQVMTARYISGTQRVKPVR